MSYPNTEPLLGTATVAATAGASTSVGTVTVTGLEAHTALALFVTAVGSAGGTTDIYLQGRHGNGLWYDVAHFPQIAGGGASVTYKVNLCRYGTMTVPVVIGAGAVPALAVNTIVPGDFGDALRLVAVTGGGAAGLRGRRGRGKASPGGFPARHARHHAALPRSARHLSRQGRCRRSGGGDPSFFSFKGRGTRPWVHPCR